MVSVGACLLLELVSLLFLCVNGQFECRVNSCLQCPDSSPVNCLVTRPDQYSYNYECRAPSHCLPETVPSNRRGYFCLLNLGIISENNVRFEAERFGFTATDNCMSVRNSLNTFKGPLRENCLDVSIQVPSFQYPRNVFCYCNEDNCQDIINVTLFVEPPPPIEPSPSSSTTGRSSTLNEVVVSSLLHSYTTSSSLFILDSSMSSIASISSSTYSMSQVFTASSVLFLNSTLTSLSFTATSSIGPSVGSTPLPTVTIALISLISVLVIVLVFITILIVFVLACYCRRYSSNSRRHSHQIQFHATAPTLEMSEESSSLPFQFLQTIGHGKFGSVWKALYNTEPVAVKIFSSHHKLSWQNERDIYLLDSTHHENVLKFIYSDSRGRSYNAEYFIVTEYHPLGSLYQFLRHNTLSWEQAWNIMYTVTSGIAHLHSTNYCNSNGFIAEKYSIAHRDIKPSNILVKDASGQCVVADLGLAFILDPAADDRKLAVSGQVGTYRYMAPEALDARVNLRDIESFKQIDVYALTLVLWEVCSRYKMDDAPLPPYQPPYFDLVGEKPSLELMKDFVVNANQRPLISGSWYNNKNLKPIISLIKDGWDEDPEARLTAANIMVRLENLIGMRAKLDPLPPQISTPAEGQGEFLSPVSEVSQSSCNKVHMSASFSGSTSVLAVPPPPFHHGRFSVDHGNNATTASMIISLNDLQARYREEMAAANVTGNDTSTVATATFDSLPSPPPPPPPPPPLDASCTIATPSAEASSTSDQQDKVNIIDVTTGQPQRLSDPQQDASISISVS